MRQIRILACSNEKYEWHIKRAIQKQGYSKKESCLQDSPPAVGRVNDTLPLRRSAILAEHFYLIGTKFPMR